MNPPGSLKELIQIFIDLINLAIPVLISLTILFFIWKLVDAWILNAGDEEKRQNGRHTALIGILVIALMVTVWAVVNFLRRSIFG